MIGLQILPAVPLSDSPGDWERLWLLPPGSLSSESSGTNLTTILINSIGLWLDGWL